MASVERETIEDGIVALRLNRPDRLNAITPGLMSNMVEHLDALKQDPACRVIILTGAGRGFCAGADIRGGLEEEPPPFDVRPGAIGTFQLQELYSSVTLRMRHLGKPIIAAVNGPAAGGGLAFVLASDVRIAAASAKFAVSFVRIGLSGCDMGTSWLLQRIVGAGRAQELLLTGRLFDAEEALRIGLVVEVVPDGQVIESALATARLIRSNSPFGVCMTKQVMWSTLETPSMNAAVDLENRTQVLTTTTADNIEARDAWLEKRPASFTSS